MKMSRISQFCYPLHWHKSGVGGFLPEIQGTYDPYVSGMCMMTEPFSPPTDFSCLGLRSSHIYPLTKKIFQLFGMLTSPMQLVQSQYQLSYKTDSYFFLRMIRFFSLSTFGITWAPAWCGHWEVVTFAVTKLLSRHIPQITWGLGVSWLLTCHHVSLVQFEQMWLDKRWWGAVELGGPGGRGCCEVQSWAILLWSEMVQQRPRSKSFWEMTQGWTSAVVNRKISRGCSPWKSLKQAHRYLKHVAKPPVTVLFSVL